MQLLLPSGKQIDSSQLISGFLRFDCTPIPISLEFQCLLDDELDQELQEGSTVIVGDHYLEMVIVKKVKQVSSIIRDDRQLIIGAYIAVLSGCEKMIEPVSRAIYLNDTSIGAALKASGSKLKVIEDVPLIQYFCAVGATPTYEIARKFREEAAVIFCNTNGQIIVKRLSQILDSEPVLNLDSSAISWVDNLTEIKHSIPNFITINADGSTIEGNLNNGLKAEYYPNLDSRRANNLSTVLVTKGTVIRSYMPHILAGDVVQVNQDKKYTILTAVHRYDTGVLGDPTVSSSKLWLAEVVKL